MSNSSVEPAFLIKSFTDRRDISSRCFAGYSVFYAAALSYLPRDYCRISITARTFIGDGIRAVSRLAKSPAHRIASRFNSAVSRWTNIRSGYPVDDQREIHARRYAIGCRCHDVIEFPCYLRRSADSAAYRQTWMHTKLQVMLIRRMSRGENDAAF